MLLNKFLVPFAITFSLIAVGCSIGLFAVGKVISHKIAGPIYSFEKYVVELMQNPDSPAARNFKLRQKDDFKNLEKLAASLKETLAQSRKMASTELPPTASDDRT